MKKHITPETIHSASTPLSQEVILWYLSMLEKTPAEKAEDLIELLESSEESSQETTSPKKTR